MSNQEALSNHQDVKTFLFICLKHTASCRGREARSTRCGGATYSVEATFYPVMERIRTQWSGKSNWEAAVDSWRILIISTRYWRRRANSSEPVGRKPTRESARCGLTQPTDRHAVTHSESDCPEDAQPSSTWDRLLTGLNAHFRHE